MEVAQCKSCGARIIWTLTMKGKRMPVDADPVENGNIALVEGENVVTSTVVEPARVPGVLLYVSHFATCPNAAQHRKR